MGGPRDDVGNLPGYSVMFGLHLQTPTLESPLPPAPLPAISRSYAETKDICRNGPQGMSDPKGHLPVAHFILPSAQGTGCDVLMFTKRETEVHKQRNSTPQFSLPFCGLCAHICAHTKPRGGRCQVSCSIILSLIPVTHGLL